MSSRGWRPAHAELVELLTDAKSFKTAFDEKRRDAMRPGTGIGLGIDDKRRGISAVGDPHLGAIQDVAVSPFLSARSRIDTTSDPEPTSDMASAPTCSPDSNFGR